MAKRRSNSKKADLPQNVLDRARQQAGIEEDSNGDSDKVIATESSVSEKAKRRRKANPVQLERSRQRGELTHEMIQNVLTHPTRVVSEEELRQEYQHVLVDLRNMGLLAAFLIAALIAYNFVA
jgi:hypothetical protein